ncbi:MAG TPA: hypothetical protein DCE41_16290, partial [Cytophagales bacterium]|nr:hypothetical protein [Cytophagales bacterium]
MSVEFSPSVNLLRDESPNQGYIVTPNVQRTWDVMTREYPKGTRSFTLVGAYGTGKSSYVLELLQSLQGQGAFADAVADMGATGWDSLVLVGESNSIIEAVAEKIQFGRTKYRPSELIKALDKYYQGLDGKGLVIVIDEFGKHLEYAAKVDPNSQLYFMQQLAEWANDATKNIWLITTLH